VALFRQPSGTTWRAIIKLAPPDPQHCHAGEQRNKSGAAPTKLPDNTTRIFLDEYRLELR
jgi:predicted component of type VI protein secretion system